MLDIAQMLTFIAIFVVDRKVEILSIAKSAPDDNFTFEFKDGDTGTIKLHSGGVFLRLELEVHGGHDERLRGISRSKVKSLEVPSRRLRYKSEATSKYLSPQGSVQRSVIEGKGWGMLVGGCARCKIKILLLCPFERTR